METTFEILEKYLDEASDLEMAIAELYMAFNRAVASDKDFWMRMASKKKSDAVVIKNIKSVCQFAGNFPKDFIPERDTIYKETSDYIRTIMLPIDEYITRKEAFNMALEIEKKVGLSIYNLIHESKQMILGSKVSKKIRYGETGHYLQIMKYMESSEDTSWELGFGN